MELETATDALSALAQESRLKVFRLLVRTGASGMAAAGGVFGAAVFRPTPFELRVGPRFDVGNLSVTARGASPSTFGSVIAAGGLNTVPTG